MLNRLNRLLWSLILLVAVPSTLVLAQPVAETPTPTPADEKPAAAPLPAAEQLLDEMIEAMGGAETHAQINNVVFRGTFEMVGVGIQGSFALYQARPDLSMSEMEAPGMGRLRQGTNGGVAWELTDIQGPRLLEGDEKQFAMRAASPDAFVRWHDLFTRAETIGTAELGEMSCYRVQMTPEHGKPEIWWIDQSTKLLVNMELTLKTAMGELAVSIHQSDYREVDGTMVAFRTRQQTMMMEVLTVYETVEFNTEIDAGVFALPDEIKALLATEEPG